MLISSFPNIQVLKKARLHIPKLPQPLHCFFLILPHPTPFGSVLEVLLPRRNIRGLDLIFLQICVKNHGLHQVVSRIGFGLKGKPLMVKANAFELSALSLVQVLHVNICSQGVVAGLEDILVFPPIELDIG